MGDVDNGQRSTSVLGTTPDIEAKSGEKKLNKKTSAKGSKKSKKRSNGHSSPQNLRGPGVLRSI